MTQAFDCVDIIGCPLVQDIEPDEHKVPKEPIGLCVAGRAVVITEDVADGLQGVSFVIIRLARLEVI